MAEQAWRQSRNDLNFFHRRGKFGKNAATQHRHCKMTLHRSPQDGRDCEEKWTAPAP